MEKKTKAYDMVLFGLRGSKPGSKTTTYRKGYCSRYERIRPDYLFWPGISIKARIRAIRAFKADLYAYPH